MASLSRGQLLVVIGVALSAGGVVTSYFALARLWLGNLDIQHFLTLSLLSMFLTISGLILIVLGARRVVPERSRAVG